MNTTYNILKDYFSSLKKKFGEVTFLYHPDDKGFIQLVFDDDEDGGIVALPEMQILLTKSGSNPNLETGIIKKHLSPALKKLKKENLFNRDSLYIYLQHVDEEKDLILEVKAKKKKSIFPDPQQFTFDLSMTNRGNGKSQWWKSIDPNSQGLIDPDYLPTKKDWSRSYQCLQDVKDDYDGHSLSKGKSQKENKRLKNIQLISENKIKKLWDYEHSDLKEIFSNRFCQMLQQIGVTNVEYYPLKTTCKATKSSSSTYYQLAVIVGLTKGILFFDEEDHDQRTNILRVDEDFDLIRADKKIMDGISHKIIRSEIYPQAFVVDNDIKEAIEANGMTGFMFKKVPFFDENEFGS